MSCSLRRLFGENTTGYRDRPATGRTPKWEELEQNKESMCGIEPERMERAVFGEIEPVELMLIRKPSERERHKGRQLFLKGSAAESCLTSWVTGAVIIADCVEALQAP